MKNIGIYIPGMELPPRGKVNLLVMFDDGTVHDNSDGQNQWQAIALPPHGRLGDLDALLARLKKDPLFSLVEQYGISGVIEAQDTIIPAEEE